ncbi:MAG: hypothetical protein V4675_14340 [Verrucomicrobiota bacterium]
MHFSPTAFQSSSQHRLPQRRKKSRSVAMAGGLVILDWLFMAISGLGLGIVLVVISVLTAMI